MRVTRKVIDSMYANAVRALNEAGVAPPEGHEWCLYQSAGIYALRWRDKATGERCDAALLPHTLGDTPLEVYDALRFIMWTAKSCAQARGAR